jgi:hypothetical protein
MKVICIVWVIVFLFATSHIRKRGFSVFPEKPCPKKGRAKKIKMEG